MKISPGPGAKKDQILCSISAGQFTELAIDLFHGCLLKPLAPSAAFSLW